MHIYPLLFAARKAGGMKNNWTEMCFSLKSKKENTATACSVKQRSINFVSTALTDFLRLSSVGYQLKKSK
jgi:hypothetical protein